MRYRGLAVALALLVGLPTGLSAAGTLIYERLGRPPELVPIAFFGPLPVFSPTLALHLIPFLLPTQLFSLAFQALAVALAVPAGLAALTAAATRGRARGGAVAETAHGSARWASAADLHRADLFATQGVVLGRWQGLPERRIVDGSDHHILLVMPPGAGKTTGPILSTLATNRASSFVLDPKGELFETSAGWRKTMGHRVIRFAPTLGPSVGESARWNPLDEIERGPGDVAQVTEMARNLISYPATSTEHGHWIAGARSLFVMLALHVIYAERLPSTLAAARELLNTAEPEKLFAELATYPHDPAGSRHRWRDALTGETQFTHPEVARQARRFKATPERERGSLVSTLQPFLDLWGDPVVARSTAESDFSLDALLDDQPTTLYASVPYHDLARIGGLMRLLLTALFRRVTLRGASRDARRLEILLDEFASLGRVPVIEDTLAYLRGYGVRCTLAVQDLNQIVRNFSKTETVTGNCGVLVATATQQAETRTLLSKLTGDTTVRYKNVSKARGGGVAGRRTTTSGWSEVKRPLLTEGEVGQLPPDRVLILKRGGPPVLAKAGRWWQL
jgi:type IV secretion system protein VirD4